MYADLHCHSTYSDGTNSPIELIEMAKKNKVKIISLVDHDTVQGIPSILKEGEKYSIEVIPGVEISTSVDGVRIHILGYYIDYSNKDLLNFFNEIAMLRTDNTKRIFNKLCSMGKIDYSWDSVLDYNKGKSWLCSSHVFEAMKNDNIYISYEEWPQFYNRNFSKKSDTYIDLDGFTAEDAINIIHKANDIPVIAHPKLIGDDRQIHKLVDYGVQGIEVYYPIHDSNDIHKYSQIAKKYNLLSTGGTDWHGQLTEWNVKLGDCGISEFDINELRKVSILDERV